MHQLKQLQSISANETEFCNFMLYIDKNTHDIIQVLTFNGGTNTYCFLFLTNTHKPLALTFFNLLKVFF